MKFANHFFISPINQILIYVFTIYQNSERKLCLNQIICYRGNYSIIQISFYQIIQPLYWKTYTQQNVFFLTFISLQDILCLNKIAITNKFNFT